jgi:acetylornithine deacetylase/succinyl-diaminopimelate desuccinylase-like protein
VSDPHAIAADAQALLAPWCAVRSTRDRPDEQRRMAEMLAAFCRDALGATVSDAAMALSPPIVHARLAGSGPRVVLYNMYDVMPADDAGWSGDPWQTRVVARDVGACVAARGAENNKGPLAVMLATLRALRAAGALACDIEILLEGEEECGSATLRGYLAHRPCLAGPARTVLFPSLCEYGGGPPRVYFGFKGIAHGTVRCAAGDWGGPQRPAHSSNAPWLANPAWQLVAALSALAEPPTGRIGAVALDAGTAALVHRLAQSFDPARELAFRAAQRYAIGGDAAALLVRVLAEASLNISGLTGGGSPATIPSEAAAQIELRLPPGLDPRETIDALRAKAGAFPGVTLAIDDAYPGWRFAPEDPGARAAIAAYESLSAQPQLWPWAPGASPAYAFEAVAPSFLIFGLGRGGNAHAPEEFATLAGLERLAASLIAVLERLAH